MTNEELQAIQEMLNRMEQRLDQKLSPVNDRLEQLTREVKGLNTRVGTLTVRADNLDDRFEALDDKATRITLTLENEITPSIDALAEGQDLTHQKLKELASREEVSDLRAEVRLLRKVVAQHSEEIEALKKAQ